MLVYDITSQESFEKIDSWKANFLDQASPETPDQFPFLLLGNKEDLNNRVVDEETAKQYAQANNMIFYETSAKNGKNIDKAIRNISDTASQMDTVPYAQHISLSVYMRFCVVCRYLDFSVMRSQKKLHSNVLSWKNSKMQILQIMEDVLVSYCKDLRILGNGKCSNMTDLQCPFFMMMSAVFLSVLIWAMFVFGTVLSYEATTFFEQTWLICLLRGANPLQ